MNTSDSINDNLVPKLGGGAFSCPHCRVYAKQSWRYHDSQYGCGYGTNANHDNRLLYTSNCELCGKSSIWYDGKIIYPHATMTIQANPDLDEAIIDDYNEAAAILQQSPRGACAILRLATQKLCKQLGESGKNLNDDIAKLVKKGLSPQIQKSLDLLRVIGNNAVHPGMVNVNDTPEIALALFKLINKIADTMITDAKEINAIYDSLPEAQKDAIRKRDHQKH